MGGSGLTALRPGCYIPGIRLRTSAARKPPVATGTWIGHPSAAPPSTTGARLRSCQGPSRCVIVPVVSATGIGPDLAGKAAGGRRLIAVVYADMVGYSRLIGLDDAGTLRRLRTLRRALIDPAIREHGGRVAQTGGDSLLIAFDSIDGAVRCAVKVQQQVPVYDGDQPPDRRIRFRIGINIGDVIPHGTDLHGDGVNIAARLEAACPVGGICVSRTVRDHVHGRLDLPFEPIGELTLKNIARPVEAFVLRLDPTADAVGLPQSALKPAVPQEVGSHGAPRLSLVVLPFTNLSGDGVPDHIVDGITEDLTTDLSRFPGFLVIDRNSAYAYKGKPIDIRRIGEELGVHYAVEGSVRKTADGALRINVQLVSTETGTHSGPTASMSRRCGGL